MWTFMRTFPARKTDSKTSLKYLTNFTPNVKMLKGRHMKDQSSQTRSHDIQQTAYYKTLGSHYKTDYHKDGEVSSLTEAQYCE